MTELNKFEEVKRKRGHGISSRDVGIIIEHDVSASGARYKVVWDADGRDPARATWHTAAELEWFQEP